jgi:hypothetical protein
MLMKAEKAVKKRVTARDVAEIMYEALRKLPEDERQARVRAIEAIKIGRRSNPKPASTRVNSRKHSRRAALPQKRAAH